MPQSSFYWARKRYGFTLIELLVVITIIAILAALLFPVFASSRAKARQAACLSNEKQIGLALMQYSQDYDELGPQEQFGVYAAGTQYIWHDALYSYIRSVAVFNCPNTAYPKGTGPVTGTYYHAGMTCLGVDAAHPLGYGINRNYFNGIADPNCPGSSACGTTYSNAPQLPRVANPFSSNGGSIILARIPTPAETVLLTDYLGEYTTAAWTLMSDLTRTDGLGLSKQVYRHGPMANVLMCDGHAKSMTQSALIATHPVKNKVGGGTTPVSYLFTIQED